MFICLFLRLTHRWHCCYVTDMQELKSCYHKFRRHFNHCAKKQRKHKEQLEWSPPAVVSPHSWCKYVISTPLPQSLIHHALVLSIPCLSHYYSMLW